MTTPVELCVCAMLLRLQLLLSGRCTQIAALTPTPNLEQDLRTRFHKVPGAAAALGLGITAIVEKAVDLASGV